MLERVLIAHHGKESSLAHAMGKDYKGLTSIFIYAVAIGLAFVNTWFSCALYVLVAAIWFIPDPRIERTMPRA